MEVIPSIYGIETVGGGHHNGTLPMSNIKLRYGEVKKEILPTDKDSRSRKYREYEVLVQQYEAGGATHRMYHNCMVLNSLCSLADHSDMALRTSDKPDYQLGNGSRVFILCTEGNDSRAVIIGGPQQRNDTSKGIHRETEFNGVNFQVQDDGSWTIINKGKTDNLGAMHPNADKDGAGTQVTVKANGDLVIATPNNKCQIEVLHKSGDINITSSDNVTIKTNDATIDASTATVKANSVSVDSSDISVGSQAAHPMVLGDNLATVLVNAFGIIGPTLPTYPQQAALAAIAAQIAIILSGTVRVST